MANTEGMSDEAMASLLTPDPVSTTTRPKSAFAERQARIRRRMEQPMGDNGRPAATVIRASPPTKKPGDASDQRDDHEPDEAVVKIEKLPPIILGSVIERDVSTRAKTGPASEQRPKSHFAAQRKKTAVDGNTGFPSVKVPIGTFMKDSSRARTATTRPVKPQPKPKKPSDTIQDKSQRDAEAMLAAMTASEINENVQDLHTALSPETIAFLKKRGQRRAETNGASDPTFAPSTDQSRRNKEQDTERQTLGISGKIDDVEEKVRVSSLLSSIRTYDELDAAYERETGTSTTENQETPIEDDWNIACNLLRSTSSRQTVWAARIVCQQLESDLSAGKSFPVGGHESWPYPTVLVVSLRCLLDAPVSQSSGLMLHTHVLRSLYALLRLRAHSDHIVDVSCWSETPASIYQEYFIDDAVPTPPFGTCYPSISAQPLASTPDGDAVAYSTTSSSTSAQKDGEMFTKDPMWTLLTRMRILPRLAQLLSSVGGKMNLPDEAIVAICGILSMLSVRSVGAASAISQHSTILASLLKMAALPPTDEGDSQYSRCLNARVALPAVIFMCTLARQSRMAAASLPIDSILLPVLAMSVETEEDHKLQKWSLILWRTMLRYGLGLSSFATYVSLSVPHLASERPPRHSLTVEFLSAFSCVCHCVRIAKRKPVREWSRVMSSGDDVQVVLSALSWLATPLRQTVHHIKGSELNEFSLTDMRVLAARLHFLQFYIAALDQDSTDDPEENKWDAPEPLDWYEIAVAMQNVTESGLLETALAMVPSTGFSRALLDADEGWVDVIPTQQEAVVSAFITALASLLPTVSRAINGSGQVVLDKQTRDLAASSCSRFKAVVVHWINAATVTPAADSRLSIPRSRRGWLNTMNFHVSRFLLPDMPAECRAAKITDLAIIRSHAFSLIGRLQPGEEAVAAILCSSDVLFQADFEPRSSVSPLSSFLMKELCSTSPARQHLDHSFRLYFGFGITADEWGPFEMGTLLSETDIPVTPTPVPFAELLLPMGPLWLPKILSGSMIPSQNDGSSIEHGSHDITRIVSASLELLLLLEDEKVDVSASYAAHLPDGAKLYYLMNVFLHPEDVLRDDRVNELVSNLFDRLLLPNKERSTGSLLGKSFSQACFDHSQISRNQQVDYVTESEELNPKDERLLSMLLGESEITTKELRPLIDFLLDLTNAYIAYGAQYEAFTKCIRVFLSFSFPPRVRCEAMRMLREVLHLLTLPGEGADPDGPELTSALNMCLFGDVVDVDEVFRDSSEVLDLIVAIIKEDGTTQKNESRWSRSHGGFFFTFAIASLARGLVTSSYSASSAEAMKRRLSLLPTETACIVFETANRLHADKEGKIRDLVSVTMGVLAEYRDTQ